MRSNNLANMLIFSAVDGRCKALDAAADGYVRSEACAVALLSAYQAEGTATAILMSGAAVNQGGRASSLTAPNGPSQQEVVHAALKTSGLSATSVSGLQLHGTGTALGDPIEVGAASGLLLEGRAQDSQPFTLLASKSALGHSEPASGIMGLAFLHQVQGGGGSEDAAREFMMLVPPLTMLPNAFFGALGLPCQQELSGAAAAPILHLSALNPHVASTVQRRGTLFMPRQPAPSAAAQPSYNTAAVFGVSAFAFQGTNAHAVLVAAAPVPLALVNPAGIAWTQDRHWLAPAPHALLGCVLSAAPGDVLFETDLRQPRHAFLWDHAVAGRHILPGAAFLEVAAAAVQAATGNEGSAVVLASIAIPAPLELPKPAVGGGSVLMLRCQVESGSGRVKVASAGPAGMREHMFGSAAATVVLHDGHTLHVNGRHGSKSSAVLLSSGWQPPPKSRDPCIRSPRRRAHLSAPA